MDRENAAGRQGHRRLIVALLALTVGATLGVAAPQALAGSRGTIFRYQPTMTLKVSPTSARPHKLITVTGRVLPIEIVGEFVSLSVQRKAPSGRWTQVRSATQLLKFAPPVSWQGTFNTEITSPYTTATQIWTGQVVYELTHTDLVSHIADYSMTSATGSYTWTDSGEEWKNGKTQHWSLTYSGTPVEDLGALRWYFATYKGVPGILGGVAGDSYEGSAYHKLTGVPVITWADGTVENNPVTISGIGAEIWPFIQSGEPPRPLLDNGHMRGSRVRTNVYTESLDWDLESSDPDLPVLAERSGFYFWGYKAAKKGVYRVRATIAETVDHFVCRSQWRKFTVK